jgi:transposase-like protein
MPRQREADTPTVVRVCPKHGVQEFSQHKKGVRDGVQRYRYRCLRCHTEYNLKHR